MQSTRQTPIVKSQGVTRTERYLANLCERSFLKLWSYPNPIKEDGDELCDLLAVFENDVFIFFDRESQQFAKDDTDILVRWNRWRKKVVDRQIATARGAERYIRSGRGIFLDQARQVPFPIQFQTEAIKVHKFVIAHGARDACAAFSDNNVYGSLGIWYAEKGSDPPRNPFVVDLDRADAVHVFDSHNLDILFAELDTVCDFRAYIEAKLKAITKYKFLAYCGEEDLLAHYFVNFNKRRNEHVIGSRKKKIDTIFIPEGGWRDFIQSGPYKRKQEANQGSYLWDKLIQRTCQNALDGTLLGDGQHFAGKSAIQEMAKEPRFSRRALSNAMTQAIRNFPEKSGPMMRNLSFMPSFHRGTGYVFLQLHVDHIDDYENEYREARRALLELACGIAKNRMPQLNKVVGIAIDAPKFSPKRNSEDFILMECEEWPDDRRDHYETANEGLNFFRSETMRARKVLATEFPAATPLSIGRNALCPCGSGKKYKKCCMT